MRENGSRQQMNDGLALMPCRRLELIQKSMLRDDPWRVGTPRTKARTIYHTGGRRSETLGSGRGTPSRSTSRIELSGDRSHPGHASRYSAVRRLAGAGRVVIAVPSFTRAAFRVALAGCRSGRPTFRGVPFCYYRCNNGIGPTAHI